MDEKEDAKQDEAKDGNKDDARKEEILKELVKKQDINSRVDIVQFLEMWIEDCGGMRWFVKEARQIFKKSPPHTKQQFLSGLMRCMTYAHKEKPVANFQEMTNEELKLFLKKVISDDTGEQGEA